MPAALSLAPLYLLGIGLLAAAPLLRTLANSPGARTAQQRWATLAGVFSIGILVDYLLILLLESLPARTRGRCGPRVRRTLPRNSRTAAVACRGTVVRRRIGCVALDLCTAGRGDRRPLRGADPHDSVTHWDARSIWFFQAKIIYFAGALTSDSPWTTLEFAHSEYPKLLPTLAARAQTSPDSGMKPCRSPRCSPYSAPPRSASSPSPDDP